MAIDESDINAAFARMLTEINSEDLVRGYVSPENKEKTDILCG